MTVHSGKPTNKPQVLFLLHLPPPVHGSSLVGQSIQQSQAINSAFQCAFINLLASKKLDDAGRVNFYKFYGYFKILGQLFWEIISFRPKLCYFALSAAGVAFYKDLLLIFVLRTFRVPVIFHLHNKGIEAYKKRWLLDFLCKLAFTNTKAILLSERLYYDVENYFPRENIRICPNGIPDIAREMTRESNKQPVILFFSNLFKDKGVITLLDACEIMAKKGLEFRCVFVGGEGDLTSQQITELVKLRDLGEQATYLGKKFGEEKFEIFHNADIFAFPTYYPQETFGLVILEAMSSSLPVITTPIAAIPDFVNDGINGFLVAPRDHEKLAERLEYLLLHPIESKKMGVSGREIFLSHYTLEHFESRIVDILKSEAK